MKLSLSSDALPGGTLEELTQVVERRAMSGLELRVGADHEHGLEEDLCLLRQEAEVQCIPSGAAAIRWLLLPRDVSLIALMMWTGAAQKLGAGLLLQNPVLDPPSGVKLALVHGSEERDVQAAVGWAKRHHAATCWEVDLKALTPETVIRVMDQSGPLLAHVRLVGGGLDALEGSSPEPGLLAFYSRLALSGFTGTITMVPSADADLEAWRRWLLHKRGWGCGSAHEKAKSKGLI